MKQKPWETLFTMRWDRESNMFAKKLRSIYTSLLKERKSIPLGQVVKMALEQAYYLNVPTELPGKDETICVPSPGKTSKKKAK